MFNASTVATGLNITGTEGRITLTFLLFRDMKHCLLTCAIKIRIKIIIKFNKFIILINLKL